MDRDLLLLLFFLLDELLFAIVGGLKAVGKCRH